MPRRRECTCLIDAPVVASWPHSVYPSGVPGSPRSPGGAVTLRSYVPDPGARRISGRRCPRPETAPCQDTANPHAPAAANAPAPPPPPGRPRARTGAGPGGSAPNSTPHYAAPRPEWPSRTTRTPASRPGTPLRRPPIRARGLGTIWGPHDTHAAGQFACNRTSRYTRTTQLSCEDACSNVLGVKGGTAGPRLWGTPRPGTVWPAHSAIWGGASPKGKTEPEGLLTQLDHLVSRIDAKREPVSGDEVICGP